jgi:hypothetical protein
MPANVIFIANQTISAGKNTLDIPRARTGQLALPISNRRVM